MSGGINKWQTSTILTAEREAELRKPIDEYVGNIQAQINDLRRDGTDKAVSIQNSLDNLKRDHVYTAQEKSRAGSAAEKGPGSRQGRRS